MRVAQLVDSLDPGGTERVAVQIANELAERGHETHLITGRRDGALACEVAPQVRRFGLARRRTVSPTAVLRLRRYLLREGVELLHAHSTSLFLASAATLSTPVRLVWHDHFGNAETVSRPRRLYALAAARASAVISVNRRLHAWAVDELGVPSRDAHLLPNWVARDEAAELAQPLPGVPGRRIVCVANLRPQKGHRHLLRAFAGVEARDATLCLVGGGAETPYGKSMIREAEELGLAGRVHFLGVRDDVPAVLRSCDIGVLASLSEGLPLALLEYGNAALPVVVTRVGDCAEVVEDENGGLLVDPGDESSLAAALTRLLADSALRARLGEGLSRRVAERHSPRAGMERLLDVYEGLATPSLRSAA